jgi:dolichyl-phosphate-mannose-protein mannosyltransferase
LHDNTSPPSEKTVRRVLSAIVLAAFGLRFWGLWNQGPHSDEFFALYNALSAASWADLMRSIRDNPQHQLAMPLLDFLVSRWTSNLVLLRLPEVLFGTFGVLVMFKIGRRAGGARLGLIAAGLLAVAMLDVEGSRMLGLSSALVLLTLLSFETLLRALDSGSVRAWLSHAAVLIVFAYAHPYAPLFAGMEGLWLLSARRKDLPAFGACAAAAAAAYLPWHLAVVAPMLGRRPFHFAAIEGGSWTGSLSRTALTWGGGVFEENLNSSHPGLRAARTALAGLSLCGFLYGLWSLRKKRDRTNEWLFIACGVPLGLSAIFLSDWALDYFFAARRTLIVLPLYLLVVARGWDDLWGKAEAASPEFRRYGGALLGGASLVFFSAVLGVNLAVGARKWNYCEKFFQAYAPGAREGDVVVFDNTNSAVKFLYFFDPSAFVRALPPRIYDSYYQFRLPENLVAARDGVHVGVFSIADPALSPEEEWPRWKAAGLRGRRLIYAGSDVPLTGRMKSFEFQRFLRGGL